MKSYLSLLLLAIIVFISACTKIKTTDIGSGLIPPIDGVNTKDTFIEVTSKNARDTFIRVPIEQDHVVGYVSDPLFGKTSATINVELKPTFFPYSFEVPKDSILSVDSVVLALSYNGLWGDSTKSLALRVSQIDLSSKMKSDTVYPSTHLVTASALLSQSAPTFVDVRTIKNVDSLQYEAAMKQIRIRLNNSLGEKFLKVFDSTDAYKNDSIFSERFGGFQISADAGFGNGLARINLLDTNTKLALYYKFKNRAGRDSAAVRYFRTDQIASAHSNYIKRDYSGAQIAGYFPSSPATPTDSLLFLQTGGVFANLKIPGISTLPNVLIHRAELIVNQEPGDASSDIFSPPLLFLAAYSEDSSRRFALYPDVQFSNGSISNLVEFGVVPFKQADAVTSKTNYTYHFNISRFVQGIVTKQNKNHQLVLYAPYFDYIYPVENTVFPSQISASPLNPAGIGMVKVAGGSTADPRRMRLHIIYSLVK